MTEPDDETIAVLLHLGDLLKRTAADELKSLLTGDSKLVIVPKSWRPQKTGTSPQTSTAPSKASQPPAAAVRAQLVEAGTPDARRRVLHGLEMTQAQARRMAADLGVKGASKATAEQAIDRILAYFADLESAAVA